MENNIKFSVKITETDLFKFNMHHAYTSIQGIFSIIVSAFIFAVWIMRIDNLVPTYQVAYPLLGVIFLFYIPFTLKMKAKQQMTQEVFEHPLEYELKDSCLQITSPVADEPAQLPWEYVYKVVTWKGYLLFYSSRINAYIIPKEQIAGQYDAIIDFVKEHVEDFRLTIK